MPSIICKDCSKEYSYNSLYYEPLSSLEMAIAAQENMDLEKTVKLTCPDCNSATFIQVDEPVTESFFLWSYYQHNGENYKLLVTLWEMGDSVAYNQKCAFKTTFKRIPKDNLEITKAAQKIVDFNTELIVKCLHCSSSLTSEGITMLLMSEMFGNIPGKGKHAKALRKGKCPQCGKKECYYLFDPVNNTNED